ncbi:MAG: universal stress protein [Chlorobiaceae bacterium]|nr:universal stress protein [Chlorobiaceae bacterium]
MQIYRNILVAIDRSPVDEVLIGHVAALAAQVGARVHLLHVVHSHTLDQERALREQAGAALEHYREVLSKEGIGVDVHIRSGEPDREILQEVEEGAYDLLVMAPHGHNLLGQILFGSVSRSLRRKIRIPLLLVRGDQQID